MASHNYGLDWIDEDALFAVTHHRLEKLLQLTAGRKLPIDPFAMVMQAKLSNSPLEEVIQFDELRSQNKTLQNAVGLWHQDVLSLSPNWVDMGANGGGVDLRTVDGYVVPGLGKPVYAEVKNRFNTIKSSDEKALWDRLDFVARSNNAYSYLIQIVPKSAEPYDEPWKPSNVVPREHVRVCDGATGYAMVFERATALEELYAVLPSLMDDVLVAEGHYVPDSINRDLMNQIYSAVIPQIR